MNDTLEGPSGTTGSQPGDGVPGAGTVGTAVAEEAKMFHALSAEVAQAKKHYSSGDLTLARTHLEQARTLVEELFESVRRATEPELRDAETLLARGEALRLAEKYEEALPLLEAAVEQDPTSSEAVGGLAATLAGLGDYDGALRASEEAVRLAPRASFPRLVKGALLSEVGHVEEGLEELQRAVELDPELPAPHQTLGQVLAGLGRLDEAVVELDQALARDPQDVPTLLLMAQCLTMLGRYPEATRIMRRVLAVDPDDPVALAQMGNVLGESGDQDEAVHFLTKALERDPDLSWAHTALGAVLVRSGKSAEGLAELDEALRLEPRDAGALLVKGQLLRDEDRLPEAIEALRKAVEADPQLASAHVSLAEALGRTGSFDEALAEFDEALRLAPGDAEAFAYKGQLLSQRGAQLWADGDADAAARRDEQAALVLARAIELDVNGTMPWMRGERGAALSRLRHFYEAVAQLDDALEIETDAANRAWMLANKGWSLFGLRRHHEALRTLDEADPAVVDTLFVITTKAEIYSDMAQFDAALALLEEAIERGADADWIYALKGWCFANSGGEGTVARSKEAYEEAYRRRADPWHLKGIANAEFALGAREEAAEKFRQIIREQREHEDVNAKALTLVGWCHYRLGEYEDAMTRLADALSLDSTLVFAHFDLALAMTCSGRHALAREEYGRAVVGASTTMPNCSRCGALAVALRDVTDARDILPLGDGAELRECVALLEKELAKAEAECAQSALEPAASSVSA